MSTYQPKILVADDAPENLWILTKVLESQGYKLQTAQTGSQALAHALTTVPDLILLDVMMPELDGYEVCRRLKLEPQTCDIPVIFISSLNHMTDKVSAFSAGGVDYVMKPFDAAEVVARVQTHLTLRQTQKQLKAANEELSQRLEELARSENLLQQYRDHLEQLVDDRTAAYRRLMAAVEQMAESLVITDAAGDILYVNPAFEQVTGYSREEALGHNPRLLKSGKHPPAFYHHMWETLNAGQVWTGRVINRRKDGVLITEESVITPVRDDNGVIVNYVSVKRDVTEALRLEEQYHQSQKMESIGRLAGGIAHDFNNLLTSIIGHTSLALELLPPEAAAQADLEVVLQNAERATGLTRQLLAFARRQVIEPRLLNLNELILNMDKMLRRLIGEDIELVTRITPDLGWVKADSGQVEQVVLNLAINARDAMPEGGQLTLETANVTLTEAYNRQHIQLIPGEYVMLSVSDTGLGMSEEVQAHLFEPFFTTKPEGQGTGLGLATCFGIIRQNNGHLWYHSELGQGTRFTVYLPRVQPGGASLGPQSQLNWTNQGTETILLVEDDQHVRTLATRILREQGYTLLEAANGAEALALLERNPSKIDLLVTDVVMPGLSGKALAEQVVAARPGLKVLFISGYTDNAITQHQPLDWEATYLQKPFSPIRLAEKVREILDNLKGLTF